MSISSRSNVKNGLCFIKANFGAIWLMALKVFISVIPLMLIIGVSAFSMMGMDALMGMSPPADVAAPVVGALPDMSHMGSQMGDAMKMPGGAMGGMMLDKLSNISVASMTFAGIGSLLGFVLVMLASSAMVVAMIRSIVLDQPLDTSIFSKMFDTMVLKYFGTVLIIMLIIGLVMAVVAALGFFVHPSAFVLALVGIYLGLRMALIPYGVAVGDINSLSEACEKTKGQIWNVFKVLVLSALVLLVFQLIIQALTFVFGMIVGTISGILLVLTMIGSLIILVPLQQIVTTSVAHLYKAIR